MLLPVFLIKIKSLLSPKILIKILIIIILIMLILKFKTKITKLDKIFKEVLSIFNNHKIFKIILNFQMTFLLQTDFQK